VVPNKFPAFEDVEDSDLTVASGVHEVIIESPWHTTEFTELSPAQIGRVLTMWRDRIATHRRVGRYKHALLFKNAGRAAGASLPHVHSQLAVLPEPPPLVRDELQAAATTYDETARCAFCRVIEDEIAAPPRVVTHGEHYIVIAAYAARQPYELWLLPTNHVAAFDKTSDGKIDNLAVLFAQLLQAIRHTLPHCAYNLILHTAPFDTHYDDRYHWHIEIVPRIAQLAGFELGGGQFINPVAPECAAENLREKLAQRDFTAESLND